MTICIEYNDKPLFDIEWYLTFNKSSKDICDYWYSEISPNTCINGVSEYLKDNINNEDFNLDEFVKDSEVIEDLRAWLHEQHNNRHIEKYNLASERHYKEFMPELKTIIENYSNKYGFIIHTD